MQMCVSQLQIKLIHDYTKLIFKLLKVDRLLDFRYFIEDSLVCER